MASDFRSALPEQPRQTFAERHLDPGNRLGEVLFGLIMVLSFTLGAGLITDEGPDATTGLLVGIVGCNLAWGIVDGMMYILGCLFDRSSKVRLLRSIQSVTDDDAALAIVAQHLDATLQPLTSAEERRLLYPEVLARLRQLAPERTYLEREDVYGAIVSFWLVLSTAIPAALPFLFIGDRFIALRVSNALLLALLFLVGFRWARYTNVNPWLFGSTLLFGGTALVAVVMALGG